MLKYRNSEFDANDVDIHDIKVSSRTLTTYTQMAFFSVIPSKKYRISLIRTKNYLLLYGQVCMLDAEPAYIRPLYIHNSLLGL